MPSINEIVDTVKAQRNPAEYDTTPHVVYLPSEVAPVVTATLVVDQLGRPQTELVLINAAEKQRLDADGNPVLDAEGNPVMDLEDVVHYLVGTWSELGRLEASLEPPFAALVREADWQLRRATTD